MILQDINKQIEKEYEARRNTAKHIIEERKKEVYVMFPEIAAIDEAINSLGILIGYAAMKRRPPKHILKGISESYLDFDAVSLNNEIKKLNEKKRALLQNAGYPADYIENAFLCKKCNDTGSVSVGNGIHERCQCSKELFAAKLKKVAGIPEKDTFDRFSVEAYPDEVNPSKYGINISPRTQMEAVYRRCCRFAENFAEDNVNNMVFVGNSGLGKTFLGNCIINELTDKGISCLYMPATSLFKPFAPGFGTPEKAAETVDFIMNCEFLLIDDLGSEKQTDTRYAELLEILNSRSLRGRSTLCKTIITTNLTPANIFSHYGERVASRILGEYDILKFAGEDIRLKKSM